jgi:UDP-N-acetyl-D-glucosamine dehydrogenase
MLAGQDCVLVVTDRSAYNWPWIVALASPIVDTRYATRGISGFKERIVLA